jgi:enoyl-CoA hydratase/3-hydroxyacyl-CoA dehydrogenase
MTQSKALAAYSETIQRVAVIGAGTMGAAIAQHFLMKQLNVVVVDLSQHSLDKGQTNIKQSLQQAADRGIMSPEAKAAMLENLSCTTQYADLADRQFVVEAVFEDMKIKQRVFQSIEQHVSDHCLIASNTSSFSISELAEPLQIKGRFLGVHYFYHAAKNKLIELIPGAETQPDNIKLLNDFYYTIDKAPIVVADVYGFAVNRFFVPWLNEAVRLNEEGLGSIAFIDKVAEEIFNVGMGPFALMNATGVPIALHAQQTLFDHFGAMYTPAKALAEQVAKKEDWDLSDTSSAADDYHQVANRLVGMTLGVAAQMVSENVTGITETDLGARLGLRWPIGPFELMNQRGITETKAIIQAVFDSHGHPLPSLLETVDSQKGFQLEHVKAHTIGTTGLLEFNSPDSMNALNPSVCAALEKAFDELDADASLNKIILFGRGKAFVAGADIKFFLNNIKANNFDIIYNFARDGQRILNKIQQSGKQTIAFLDGITLGGGLELALACDNRIGSKRLSTAFPETGIGIYPGLGGTQRTARLLGKGMAKYLVATGATLNAEQALGCGLVDALAPPCDVLEEIAALSASPMTTAKPLAEAAAFEHFDGDISAPEVTDFNKVLSRKAPLALTTAMQLIDNGFELSLAEGLDLEVQGIRKMFASKDALIGLSSLTTGSRPSYTGS